MEIIISSLKCIILKAYHISQLALTVVGINDLKGMCSVLQNVSHNNKQCIPSAKSSLQSINCIKKLFSCLNV